MGVVSRLYDWYARQGKKKYDSAVFDPNAIYIASMPLNGERFDYLLPVMESGAARDHYLVGIREPYSTRVFFDYMRELPKDVVHVDVGAHYGYYAVIASRFHEVRAYEPLGGAVKDALMENMAANAMYPYYIYNEAVWPGGGEVTFHVADSANFSSVVASTGDEVTVPAVDPEGVVPDGRYTLRMDIEGGEIEVLPRFLDVSLPEVIFIEHHPNIVGVDATKQLFALLLKRGYAPRFYFEPIAPVMLMPGWEIFEKLGYIGYQGGEEVIDAVLSRGWVVHAVWVRSE